MKQKARLRVCGRATKRQFENLAPPSILGRRVLEQPRIVLPSSASSLPSAIIKHASEALEALEALSFSSGSLMLMIKV